MKRTNGWILSAAIYLAIMLCVRADINRQSSVPQIKLIENYQEPKNIMFFSMLGGASHASWVLSILDELSKRGHRITFVTSDRQKKFSDPYPHFNTTVIRKVAVPADYKSTKMQEIQFLTLFKSLLESSAKNFAEDYSASKNILAEKEVDVVLCDFGGSNGCYEAAIATKTPYILTFAFAMTRDASAPYINNNIVTMYDSTTLHMSFIHRFIDMFITSMKVIYTIAPALKQLDQSRQAAGCNETGFGLNSNAHRNNLKLVNSLFGIEPARPLGPLVEFVGPIIPRNFEPLGSELSHFLSTHKRIIYIAFGQHAVASPNDKQLLLTAVLEAIESGTYDGFVWVLGRSADSDFAESIKTRSGTTYLVKDILSQTYSFARFINWAPQTAVVLHPSVIVFLTHGGAGSLHEGLYGGKRLIVFPFFGDQFPNAHTVERNKLGGFLRRKASQKEAIDTLERIGRDDDGVYQKNVNRYKALVQIHSRHGPIRAADLVEEVLFASLDGMLPYRYEHSRYMSIFKAHNIDLYLAALGIVSVIIYASFWGLQRMFRWYMKPNTRDRSVRPKIY